MIIQSDGVNREKEKKYEISLEQNRWLIIFDIGELHSL